MNDPTPTQRDALRRLDTLVIDPMPGITGRQLADVLAINYPALRGRMYEDRRNPKDTPRVPPADFNIGTDHMPMWRWKPETVREFLLSQPEAIGGER